MGQAGKAYLGGESVWPGQGGIYLGEEGTGREWGRAGQREPGCGLRHRVGEEAWLGRGC